MKIAVVGPGHPIRGGISHYTTMMVRHLRGNHDVLFVSYRKQYPGFLYPGRTQLDDSLAAVRTDCLPIISYQNPVTWLKAARSVCDFHPEVLVLSWVSTAHAIQFRIIKGHVRRKSPGTRIVFLCHNVMQHEDRAFDGLLSRIAMAGGDGFIVHDDTDRDCLLALLPDANIKKVALPLFDCFPTHDIPGTEAKRGLGFGEDDQVALYFGFVRPYKGLMHLLRALPQAREQLPGLRLLVVGEFWERREAYEREIRSLGVAGAVKIVDRYVPNEEVGLYFRAADVVVLPYVTATGSAIVQVAYSFSKPVITTRVGGLPEAVDDGVTGILVEPKDPDGLARALVSFFKRGLGPDFARNIQALRSRFSWDLLVQAIVASGSNE